MTGPSTSYKLRTVNETEDIVEDEVAATIRLEQEGLGVVHGPLLLVDLHAEDRLVSCPETDEPLALVESGNKTKERNRGRRHTRRAPVTETMMAPLMEGWASRVET